MYEGNSPEHKRSFGIKDDGYSAVRLRPLYKVGTEIMSGGTTSVIFRLLL